MRTIKKIGLILIALILLLACGVWLYFNHLKPSYQGKITLTGIENETSVYFDDYGIPHIYAESELDAQTALGYVHAQDRLFQMELLRRIAPSKLSEIFGKEMLEADIFFAKLGIDEASEKTIAQLNKSDKSVQLAMAYLNGINQFIDNGPTPIEFTLIGIEKKHFELKDVYNIVGYMAFSFAMAQKTDPLLSIIEEKLGSTYLEELGIDVDPNSTLIKNSKSSVDTYQNLVTNIHKALETTPVPQFIGSNSWVVSPEKTVNKKVLFANDPHIGYSQPSVWYEAHINTPNHEMYGYYIAGIPYPLLGHNRNYAYGLTMFENDDIDFYKEENNPSDSLQYKTPLGFKKYNTTTKTIKVKDEESITITVKNSRHGPIMNSSIDAISQKEPIAMWWVYTQTENKILEAVHQLSHAKTMEDAKNGASLIHGPGLNIMYGDAEGTIAWWAAGKLYKIKSEANRKFVLNGASGEDDLLNYFDFKENPMAENPSWKYVYSANNQPDSIVNSLYPGYYLPEDRAKRIVQLISSKNNWTKEAMATMLLDNTSSTSKEIIKEFTQNMNYNSFPKKVQNAIDILQLWDGSNNENDIAPTIYNKWVYLYLKNTFEDELGEELFNQLLVTHFLKRTFSTQLKNEYSIWWDNISTKNKVESKQEILSKSIIETVSSLENQLGSEIMNWNWGKVLTLEHPHPFGKVSYLKKYFTIGPFPANGSREVIDNKIFEYTNSGYYMATGGPSTRRIVDFSDIENSISILPTGQSGNPFSKHFKDQAEMYHKGAFRKMKMNKEEIVATSTKLTISSKK